MTQTCGKCDQVFVTKTALDEHMLSHDAKKQGKKKGRPGRAGNQIPCGDCDEVFFRRCDLRLHRRMKHRYRKDACGVCGRTFTSERRLKMHYQFHNVDGEYECFYCMKRFNKGWKLKIHFVNHSGKPPYICQYCDDDFLYPGKILEHLKRDHDIYLACKDCGEAFRTYKEQDNHVCRLYSCKDCDMTFVTMDDLAIHIKCHKIEKDNFSISQAVSQVCNGTASVSISESLNSCPPVYDFNIPLRLSPKEVNFPPSPPVEFELHTCPPSVEVEVLPCSMSDKVNLHEKNIKESSVEFEVLPCPPSVKDEVLPCPPVKNVVLSCPPVKNVVVLCPPLKDEVLPCPPSVKNVVLSCPPSVKNVVLLCPPVKDEVLPCPPSVKNVVLSCPPVKDVVLLCPPVKDEVLPCPPSVKDEVLPCPPSVKDEVLPCPSKEVNLQKKNIEESDTNSSSKMVVKYLDFETAFNIPESLSKKITKNKNVCGEAIELSDGKRNVTLRKNINLAYSDDPDTDAGISVVNGTSGDYIFKVPTTNMNYSKRYISILQKKQENSEQRIKTNNGMANEWNINFARNTFVKQDQGSLESWLSSDSSSCMTNDFVFGLDIKVPHNSLDLPYNSSKIVIKKEEDMSFEDLCQF